MNILHIFKSEPDQTTKALTDIISEGNNTEVFQLFDEETDYEMLIDKIFTNDKVISWW
jgi:hypothetical protein